MRGWALLGIGLLSAVGLGAACASEQGVATGQGAGGSGGEAGVGGSGGSGGAGPSPSAFCEEQDLPVRPFDFAGEYGIRRHDAAEDFTVPLLDGSGWTLSEAWSGCESYVFVTSARTVSALDDGSIWERDVDALIAKSPLNAHYFFVAARSADAAEAELTGMQARIDDALAALEPSAADHWRSRLHVVAGHYTALDNWIETLIAGQGRGGFAIDRFQRIRLLGHFADVNRFSAQLNQAGEWPWQQNLAYAAYEPRYYNYEARRAAELAEAEDGWIVTPWEGVVLSGTVEIEVEFPPAEAMAGFDTLEIDLTMDCSDPDGPEFGNCGAWDYLSHIHLLDDDSETWLEVARFITTYHRAGRYVVDATPLLAHLAGGGKRTIRYIVSPDWNPQAYLTRMDFSFTHRGKGMRPTKAVPLWEGGSLGSGYNDAHPPIDVAIPAGAKKVELWALITGHGMEKANCAEFCRHQHAFTVGGGKTHLKDHPTVNQNEGCVAEIDDGMVPNQGGTWWFGRGGWCPGQQVKPFIADVTAEATPGETTTVTYQASLAGNPPPDGSGNIVMTSYLVIYE